jgi:hypothetical protein
VGRVWSTGTDGYIGEKIYPAEFDCPQRAYNRSRLGISCRRGKESHPAALQAREEEGSGEEEDARRWCRRRRRGFRRGGERGARGIEGEGRDFCGTESKRGTEVGDGTRREVGDDLASRHQLRRANVKLSTATYMGTTMVNFGKK